MENIDYGRIPVKGIIMDREKNPRIGQIKIVKKGIVMTLSTIRESKQQEYVSLEIPVLGRGLFTKKEIESALNRSDKIRTKFNLTRDSGKVFGGLNRELRKRGLY